MSEMERADKGDGMPKKVCLGQGTPTSGGWHLRLSQGSQDECAGRPGSPRLPQAFASLSALCSTQAAVARTHMPLSFEKKES